MLKLSAGAGNCFLLESVEGGAVRGRYSIIGIAPDLVFRAFGGKAEVNNDPKTQPDAFEAMDEPTLQALRRVIQDSHIQLPAELPPMSAGVFGYIRACRWPSRPAADARSSRACPAPLVPSLARAARPTAIALSRFGIRLISRSLRVEGSTWSVPAVADSEVTPAAPVAAMKWRRVRPSLFMLRSSAPGDPQVAGRGPRSGRSETPSQRL
ncbi:MAG: hypothetical protein AAF501_13380 [Pseudomonadota bacterium]